MLYYMIIEFFNFVVVSNIHNVVCNVYDVVQMSYIICMFKEINVILYKIRYDLSKIRNYMYIQPSNVLKRLTPTIPRMKISHFISHAKLTFHICSVLILHREFHL